MRGLPFFYWSEAPGGLVRNRTPLNRAFRQRLQECASIALSDNSRIGDHHQTTVCTGPNESPEALAEPNDRFGKLILPKRLSTRLPYRI